MTRLTFPETDRERGQRFLHLADTLDSALGHPSGHSVKIADRCCSIAAAFALPESSITELKIAALGRGLGLQKLNLGALARSGPLTMFEYAELWRHPVLAEQRLSTQDGGKLACLIVRWHHEWWNGLGYPDRIAAETIPIESRILRAAETYETLLVARPHRPAFSRVESAQIVARGAGLEFDPHVAAALLSMIGPDDADVWAVASTTDETTHEAEA